MTGPRRSTARGQGRPQRIVTLKLDRDEDKDINHESGNQNVDRNSMEIIMTSQGQWKKQLYSFLTVHNGETKQERT